MLLLFGTLEYLIWIGYNIPFQGMSFLDNNQSKLIMHWVFENCSSIQQLKQLLCIFLFNIWNFSYLLDLIVIIVHGWSVYNRILNNWKPFSFTATVFGQGVYFAVNSGLSVLDTYSPPNADGHKFIFMAKVLTGDFTEGKHEMKTAPLKQNTSELIRYHSVTDKVKSPTLFVIFNDTQAYPGYLITCKKIYI